MIECQRPKLCKLLALKNDYLPTYKLSRVSSASVSYLIPKFLKMNEILVLIAMSREDT